MAGRIQSPPRFRLTRFVAVWSSQIFIFAAAGVATFLLRFDFVIPPRFLSHLEWAIAAWILVKTTVFYFARVSQGGWRYVSVNDSIRLLIANVAGSLISGIIILRFGPEGFPRSVYFIDFVLCLLGTGAIRVGVRTMAEYGQAMRSAGGKPTFIYGAGTAGVTLLREIRNNPKLSYRIVGLLDDQPAMKGLRIAGVPVLGGGESVAHLVKRFNVEMILVAIPSASGAEMSRILSVCQASGVKCKTVPGLEEIVEGHGLAGQIREVAVEDLLGRVPVQLEEDRIRENIQGKVVLVTGAAGSIGSELCRQIARFDPAAIVGFEVAESPLFDIECEMQRRFPSVPFHAEIGNIQNYARLETVFRKYKPAVVYHAAAYKHVPLMETHIFEAIENNVFGTYNVAAVSAQTGVESFILISSDKAVRPTNVMGATKRIAELIILGLRKGPTRYVAVRFGNVLGSNGSVIPTFKRQIAVGGPVTVTHPDMRRFFMTIPEACQLVLQASAIGTNGQVCVLDMGEPVKIVDLACNLIRLSGLRPNDDIEIKFTGVRPGEKLYEETNSLLEDTIPTEHDKIRIFVGVSSPGDVQALLRNFRDVCKNHDAARLVIMLKELVWDYNPSVHLLKLAVASAEPAGAGNGNVLPGGHTELNVSATAASV